MLTHPRIVIMTVINYRKASDAISSKKPDARPPSLGGDGTMPQPAGILGSRHHREDFLGSY
jgi:hypothetical protein